MKKFLKNYWLFIILAFLASILASWYLINKFITPEKIKKSVDLLSIPQQKINSYPLETKPNFNYLINNFPDMVKNLEVYEVEPLIFSEKDLLAFKEKFGFNDEPKIIKDETTKELIYIWGNVKESLSISPVKASIDYTFIDDSQDTSIKTTLDVDVTKSYVKNFLTEKGLYPESEKISLEVKNLSYLKPNGSEYEETKTLNETSIINLEFQYLINDYSLLETGVSSIIRDNNEILKLYYRPSFKKIKGIGLYPIKNKEEIVDNLKSLNSINYFEIINDYSLPEESKDIKTADFDKIEIIYIKNNTNQSYLQPFFFIKGQAILNDGRKAEIGIYLPAIKDEYLLK
jgi:hypothetical protein